MTDLPSFADQADFENASRGFVAALTPGVVTAADGRVVWDVDAYGFLEDDCPQTVNPSLWRQGQLCRKQGLSRSPTGSTRSGASTSRTSPSSKATPG